MTPYVPRAWHWRLVAVLATFLPAPMLAQVSYARAEQLLGWNTSNLVSGDQVTSQWLRDGNRFYYRNKTVDGAEFVLIDPALEHAAAVLRP
jgi:hypothetical protein